MSLWTRISDAMAALSEGQSLGEVLANLRTPPQRTVAFTIAVIALGAKMAKADGLVTRDEVTAFREVFHVAPEDESGAARLFDMARTDIAGYEDYARAIRRMFARDPSMLCDIMEGLFHIAVADGVYHPGEDEFLGTVSQIFGQSDAQFSALRARFWPNAPTDPYTVLGVTPHMPTDEIRKVWRDLVRQTHPDSMIARGVPKEAIHLAEKRMADINRAWDEINQGRA